MSAFCGEPAEGEAKLSLDVPPPPSESETEGLKQMVALLRDAGAAEAAGAPVDDPLYSDERALLRYLRARKGDPDAAAAMLRGTAAWRREFGWAAVAAAADGGVIDRAAEADAAEDAPPGVADACALVRLENETGKMFVRGRDRRGHAVLYMRGHLENTNEYRGNLTHLVYNLERGARANDAAGTGVEKFGLIIDFSGFSIRKQPPMKTSLDTLSILQNHYPERLGVAYLVDAPWAFSAFFSAISPFIDPVTREKIQFVKGSTAEKRALLVQHIDPAVLQSDIYGDLETEFASDVYLRGRAGEDFDATLARVSSDRSVGTQGGTSPEV